MCIRDRANGVYDAISTGSWGPKISGQTVTDWTGSDNPLTADPDDLKNFLQTGTNFTNSVAVTGGNDKATFRLGYTNLDSKGLIPNSTLKRNMITVRTTAQLTEKFKADAKISYNNEEVYNRPETSGSISNIFRGYISTPRNIQFKHQDPWMAADGTMNMWSPISFSTRRNPYWVINEDSNEDNTDRVFTMVKLDYTFAPWLKANKLKDLEYVKEYYGYSDVKAKSALEILSDEQINTIKNRLNKGGRK